TPEERSGLIGYLPQDALLFSGSLRENLTLERGGGSHDDPFLLHAVRLATLEEDVLRFPRGLDTEIGELGVRISGGQRQRVGLARAIAAAAPRFPGLLVLDDPFSAVDVATEARIVASLKQAFGAEARPADRVTIVDDHLIIGRSSGLLALACLYLAASAAVQSMTFLYSYLAATIAQGVLSGLRVRLFAHLQRLPASYFDRTPLGDVISRCTSDVETLDTVFSSGVAVLVANLVRLLTIGTGMIVLSAPLTLVTALVIPPLVWAIRFLQVRVRHAERANRTAVGALT